ncbi:MAG: response regulator [Ketobacter sp.]|nr:MAG: response regulator [Ketobacter sp.]
MALELIPYHKKRVLIIEDMAEMRTSLKSMLNNMGVNLMETVGNGEEAIIKLSYNNYDIVFSDYELGRGKDGQQVLEEMKASGKMPASTAYIMVTAAQTVEMVMGALEYEPDGYIAKPVTLDILRTRLNRIIRTKEVYREINQFIDRKDINGALEACNRLAVERPKFALPAYRIKGKLLLNEERYEEARDIYDTVLGIKRVAWAVLGMGKVEFQQGNYEAAQKLLEGLTRTKAKYVEASDWLAKALEAQGKYKAAQQVLEQAVEQSPKAIRRQQALARLADLNGDADVMFKASKKASILTKNSAFRDADNQIRYAKALQKVLKYGGMREQKIASKEAMVALESVKTVTDLTSLQLLKCGLVEAQTLFNSNREDVARIAYSGSLAMMGDDLQLSPDDKLDLLAAKLVMEDEASSQAYAATLLNEIGNDPRLLKKYYGVLDFHLIPDPQKRHALLKQRGAELLQLKDYEGAWEIYYKATRLPITDSDCQIAALQAAVGLYREGPRSSERLQLTNALFGELQDMSNNDPHYPELEKLRLQWTRQTQEDDDQSTTG